MHAPRRCENFAKLIRTYRQIGGWKLFVTADLLGITALRTIGAIILVQFGTKMGFFLGLLPEPIDI